MKIPDIAFNQNKNNLSGFEILDLESLYERSYQDSHPSKPHRVKFFLLIYIEQGEGAHMVDFIEHPYQKGSVIFVQREQVQSFDFVNKPKGKLLLFTQSFLDQVHANMRLPNYTPTHLNRHHSPILKLDNENILRSENLLKELSNETAHSNCDELIVMYLFCSLSLILHRLRPKLRHDKLSHKQSKMFASFLSLLFEHFKKIRDANWYADSIGTTYKTLNHICKLSTDLTAKQLIDSYATLEIKRLLLVSNITTQKIAYDFGFEDPSNFVKYFKKHTGFTPSKFQKKYTI